MIKNIKFYYLLFYNFSVLSPKSVNKIQIKFWQNEKFCDEVSTLRLPGKFIVCSILIFFSLK